jgi:hypothetical protein
VTHRRKPWNHGALATSPAGHSRQTIRKRKQTRQISPAARNPPPR